MARPIKTIAVIGAGVSGVVATAHLRAAGLDVTVFERTDKPGGVWVFDPRIPPDPAYPSLVPSAAETAYFQENEAATKAEKASGDVGKVEDVAVLHAPPGPCYELLQNNIPTPLMKLTFNSWPPGTGEGTGGIVRHNVLAEYIQDTADKTGVNEVAQFNTKVEHVEKEGDHWRVKTSTLDPKTLELTKETWEFDAVIVASGHYHAPKVPDIPGLKEWKEIYPSRIRHSKLYRSTRGYQGKNVLLIGGSTSSFDIAKELVGIASKIYQSTRNGEFDLPVSMLPPGVTRISEISSFNLSSSPTSSSEHIPGTVTLKSGETISNIDRIVVATGYHCTYPFLPQYHRDGIAPENADATALVTDGTQMHNLHKDIFYIPDPTLAFIGVPYYTATFSLFEFQAVAVAAVFSGKVPLPEEKAAREEYENRIKEKGVGKAFHSLKGKDKEYADELLAWVNPGIVASGGEPVPGHTKEWQDEYDALKKKFAALFDPSGGKGEKVIDIVTEQVAETEVH